MSSLEKFGVPMGSGSGRGGLLQPKFKNRFRCRFVGFGPIAGGIELSQQVQSVDRPSLTHDEIEVDSYNSKAYYAGKHRFNTINLVLKDDVTNAVTKLVAHQEQKQLNHFEQTAFAAGINYKFNMFIEVMDGGNDVVLESWYLEGCWVQSFNYESLDYSQSALQTISLTIRFDNATLENGLMTNNPEFIPGYRV